MIFNGFVVFIGLLLSALFSTFETALVSSDPLKIYVRVRNRKKLKQFMNFFQNPARAVNSLIVIINVVDITVAIFVLQIFRAYFPIIQAGIYATIFSILVTLTFGEIIPKAIALSYPQFVIFHFFSIVRYFLLIASPFVYILDRLTSFFFPRLWKERGNSPIRRSDVELLFHQNSNFQSQHLVEMIYRVLSIDNIRIKEAKIPISEVLAFSKSTTVRDFQKDLAKEYYSRIPVYDEDIFDIVGYVNTKDIFFAPDLNQTIESFSNEAIFFPENKPVDEVIVGMEEEHIPIAFVIDEFGAVSGMVTRNNLIEIIVEGAAQDGAGQGKGFVIKSQDGWIVSGRQDIDELNDRLGLGIKKDGFETLAGFVMSWFRRIPNVGDSFTYHSFMYQVKEMHKFAISKVEISKHLILDNTELPKNSINV